MVISLCSDQQGSRSRQTSCQVQPTDKIGNLLASRLCFWVRTTVSTVWSAASISELELQATERKRLMCCPPNMVINSDTRSYSDTRSVLSLGGLHENKLWDNLQAMAPTNVKTVHRTSSLHIEGNLDRLGLLSPTHGQRSRPQSG